mmetsp:Transcript_7567/g.13336  ORF Transcript_7567/g.13336 Transcript_7567/m.13336 type:complete len:351 (+) Transcript_7567:1031-2083(+)
MDEESTISGVGGLGITHNHFHQGSFTRTVGSNQTDTRTQRHLQVNVRQCVHIITGITVVDTLHLQKSLGGGTNALETTRIREDKFEICCGKLKVMFRLGLLLDEGGHLSGVVNKFAMWAPLRTVLVVNDITAHLLQERRIVTYNQHGRIPQANQILLQPPHRLMIQVVRGFVHKQDIRIDKHSLRQSQFHLPPSGQFANGTLHHGIGELELLQHGPTFLLVLGGGLHQVIKDNLGLVHRIHIASRVDVLGAQLRRPSFQLAIVDGIHESGFTHTVLTHKSVAMTTTQSELGLVEEDLASVRQGEAKVGELLAAKLILLVRGIVVVLKGGDGRRAEFSDGLFHGIGVRLGG